MADEDQNGQPQTCPPDCKCHDCDYDSEDKPFVATTVEPFDRFNSKSVAMDCGGKRGIQNLCIPRYLAMNFHFEKDNMVPEGKQFVINVLKNGGLAVVAIYEG
jgi:hypothetical protein